jgi:uncharacterized protein (DUF4415 family)
MSKTSTRTSASLKRVKVSDETRRLWAERDNSKDDPENPVMSPEAWEENGVIGKYYRPIKTAISLRVDNDVLDWLKSKGEGHLSRINQILRERMMAERNSG